MKKAAIIVISVLFIAGVFNALMEEAKIIVAKEGSQIQPKKEEYKEYKEYKEYYDVLLGGYPVCTTEEMFDTMITALSNNDTMLINHLNKECVDLGGYKFSVLEKKWFKAKVLIYIEDDLTAIGWTNIENIKDI